MTVARAMLRAMTKTELPAGLSTLVKSYEGRNQSDVPFRVLSWQKALSEVPSRATEILTDEVYTAPAKLPGDRLIGRGQLLSACHAMDLANENDVVSTFVLVMAWGSGLTGSRGLRNAARALTDIPRAHGCLLTPLVASEGRSHSQMAHWSKHTRSFVCRACGNPSSPSGSRLPARCRDGCGNR